MKSISFSSFRSVDWRSRTRYTLHQRCIKFGRFTQILGILNLTFKGIPLVGSILSWNTIYLVLLNFDPFICLFLLRSDQSRDKIYFMQNRKVVFARKTGCGEQLAGARRSRSELSVRAATQSPTQLSVRVHSELETRDKETKPNWKWRRRGRSWKKWTMTPSPVVREVPAPRRGAIAAAAGQTQSETRSSMGPVGQVKRQTHGQTETDKDIDRQTYSLQ